LLKHLIFLFRKFMGSWHENVHDIYIIHEYLKEAGGLEQRTGNFKINGYHFRKNFYCIILIVRRNELIFFTFRSYQINQLVFHYFNCFLVLFHFHFIFFAHLFIVLIFFTFVGIRLTYEKLLQLVKSCLRFLIHLPCNWWQLSNIGAL